MSFLLDIVGDGIRFQDDGEATRTFNKYTTYWKPLHVRSTLMIEYKLMNDFKFNKFDNHIALYSSKNTWSAIRIETNLIYKDVDGVLKHDTITPLSSQMSEFGKWRVAYDKVESSSSSNIPIDLSDAFSLVGYGTWWYFDRGISMILQRPESDEKLFIYYELIGQDTPIVDESAATTNTTTAESAAASSATTPLNGFIPEVPVFGADGLIIDFPKIDFTLDASNLSITASNYMPTYSGNSIGNKLTTPVLSKPTAIIPSLYWFSKRSSEFDKLDFNGVAGPKIDV